MKDVQKADKSADKLGMFFRDICEEMDGFPISRMHQAISTPKYFAASVLPAISWEGMMNLGANIMYSVVYCTKDAPMPNFTDDVTKEINRKLDDFYAEQTAESNGYDGVLHTYGLKIVNGERFIVSVAKRTDIVELGGRLKKNLHVQSGNEATVMAKSYNNLIGLAISEARERVPGYVA